MSETDTDVQYKWQPVMLVTDHRIECEECGALAVFIVVEGYVDSQSQASVDAYCQECFKRHQDEDE